VLRVADFNTFYSPEGGGVRNYIERKLAFYEQRADTSYSLIIPGASNGLEVRGRTRIYSIKGRPIPKANNYRWTVAVRELRRILKAERPQVIEVGAPYLSPLLIRAAAYGLRTKLVGFWHANYPEAYIAAALQPLGAPIAKAGEWIGWRYAKQTYGRFDAVFAASRMMRTKLTDHGFEPVYLTPLGADTDLYTPDRRGGDVGSRIVFAARLSREKGLHTLLEAYPLLRKIHPEATLSIAGGGPLFLDAKALSESDSSVSCLGYLSEPGKVADLMANAAVVAVPSGYDTFSLTTVEALSSGAAVVCADQGAAGELVERSGVGLSFRMDDAADLARALAEVLSWSTKKRKKMSAQARTFAVENHRWDHVFEHQLSCYRQVVGRLPLWA
jgi:alpha-1,6-mannosyltransferase